VPATLQAIIVNYRVAGLAVEAVRSLIHDMQGLEGGVTVVDNDSGDGSVEHLERAVRDNGWGDRVRILPSGRNGGFGFGNNVGIRDALARPNPPEFFFLLNPDARVRPGTLRALSNFLEANPRAAIAGARMFGPGGQPAASAFRFPTVLSEFESTIQFGPVSRLLESYIVARPGPGRTCEVDWVSGAAFMVRRTALERVGLFDERFFLYYEEIDLCRRMRQAGFTVHHVHETGVDHEEEAATGINKRRRPTYWFDSRQYYFDKSHGRAYRVAANVAWVLGASLHRARCAVTGRAPGLPQYMVRDFVRHALGSSQKQSRSAEPRERATVPLEPAE